MADEEKLTRHEKQSMRRHERESTSQASTTNRKKARIHKKIFLFAAIIAVVAIAVYAFTLIKKEDEPAVPSALDDFAKCTTDKGAIMYGTEWCPHCQAQKKMFGTSFQYATYVDCDASSGVCNAVGITSYPTWVFANGDRVSGTQDLNTLASKTGCKL